MGGLDVMFRSEDEKQYSNRQQVITLLLAVALIVLYLWNIIPQSGSEIKINNLWVFFFPIQILTTLYSVWRYTTRSGNLLLLQSVLLLLSWVTRFSVTFDPASFMTNSYFIYDLSTKFEIGISISIEEILYIIFSISAIALSIQPVLKRNLLKQPALASELDHRVHINVNNFI